MRPVFFDLRDCSDARSCVRFPRRDLWDCGEETYLLLRDEVAVGALPQALAGDREAVRRLIDALTPIVQARVARTLLRRRAEARGRPIRQEVEDCTQEVFLALFADDAAVLRAWKVERGLSLVNFVGLIAEREVASILRSGKRSPWTEDPTFGDSIETLSEPSPGPEPMVASRQALEALLDRLRANLTPKGLDLFKRLYVQERTVEEVRAETGMSEDAIYAWRSRLRKLLKKLGQDLLSDSRGEARKPQQTDPP